MLVLIFLAGVANSIMDILDNSVSYNESILPQKYRTKLVKETVRFRSRLAGNKFVSLSTAKIAATNGWYWGKTIMVCLLAGLFAYAKQRPAQYLPYIGFFLHFLTFIILFCAGYLATLVLLTRTRASKTTGITDSTNS